MVMIWEKKKSLSMRRKKGDIAVTCGFQGEVQIIEKTSAILCGVQHCQQR